MITINGQTKLCLLLGNPVEHSLSPMLHNTAYKALGINYAYLASRVEKDRIGEAVIGIRALSAAGANVTSPFKEAVIPYLDSISEVAKTIKSVNTIVNYDGHLYGDTTDGAGFYQALKQSAADYDLNQPLVLIGAGGAARAIAYTMANSGVSEILIVNRSLSKARDLAALLNKKTAINNCYALALDDPGLPKELKSYRLFVYTLPADLDSFTGLLCQSGMDLSKNIFIDLRYNPAQSTLMQQFKKMGGRSYNGLDMLIWQAVIAFEKITGKKAPVSEMQKAVR